MIKDLMENFSTLEDPRCAAKVEHRLIDILVIAVCAVLAGAESFEDIALYGRCKQQWLRRFVELPGGIPSHDTFRRVLMLIDPDAFERCFLGWVRAVFDQGQAAGRQIAIDGKTVRRSFDRRQGRSALHLVSAFATESGVVLMQRATAEQAGELSALPAVLDGLNLKGCLLSLDALGCQRTTAEEIVGRGGEYLLTLKANQGTIYQEVQSWFAAHAFARGATLRPRLDEFDDGHGRLVRRRVFVCRNVKQFKTLAGWPAIHTVLATETIRSVNGTGQTTAEIRHYLSSSQAPPKLLALAIRKHWAIENGLHWVLDVGFGEDQSRVRERAAARNLALLRRIALNIARADISSKGSLKAKRKRAAWDDPFMAKLVGS
jgi:predicted transposase YbfD/YdcC